MTSSEEGNYNVFQPNFLYEYEVLGTKYQENGAKKMLKRKEGETVQEKRDYACRGQQGVADYGVGQFEWSVLE